MGGQGTKSKRELLINFIYKNSTKKYVKSTCEKLYGVSLQQFRQN